MYWNAGFIHEFVFSFLRKKIAKNKGVLHGHKNAH